MSAAPDFHKYHALGNDYLVIDPNTTPFPLTPEAIRLVCHRHVGVGSDGVLYGPIRTGEVLSLRIFNPDGSEAEKSGNGIRIFSRYLLEAGYVRGKTFALQTPGGRVAVEALDDHGGMIAVDMGEATFRSDRIPVSGPSRDVVDEPLELDGRIYRVTCVSVGNPHCVIPLPEVSKAQACALGPLVERHSSFPNRINMQLLKVLDRRTIQIEIWERGAGYTLASGSSSCAAAYAAHRLGLADRRIAVQMPGGRIDIELTDDGHLHMTGPVSSVTAGRFSPELRRGLGMPA